MQTIRQGRKVGTPSFQKKLKTDLKSVSVTIRENKSLKKNQKMVRVLRAIFVFSFKTRMIERILQK
ncbi:hypothetical protein CH380_20355 [Leptospira adleri]|uniref:Uncharacterized protein n=1 Tax=Leptospira adleri TaxID=2023186 RepID=A0A2M9YIR1_9LEPT|nr:hypothetical protein CH380_20355 [Leptospira adleri]PJZ63305.1 hypothetical protein CH376_03440 [Leptospira adleri]